MIGSNQGLISVIKSDTNNLERRERGEIGEETHRDRLTLSKCIIVYVLYLKSKYTIS